MAALEEHGKPVSVYEIKLRTRPLRIAIRDGNDEKVKQIITYKNLDITELHINPNRYLFYVGYDVLVPEYVSKNELTKVFDAFVECGLDLDDYFILDRYFFYAILHTKYKMVAYLLHKIGSTRVKHMLYNPDDRDHRSILFYALNVGDVQMIHKFALDDINFNIPVQSGDGNVIYPICIAIAKQNVPLLKYMLNLPNFIFYVPNCNLGNGIIMQGQSSSKIAEDSPNIEIKQLLNNAYINSNAAEITLERRIYMTMIINSIVPYDIPRYIKSKNYQWLMSTQNPSLLVRQAKKIILDYLARKRQREESTE